MDIFKKMPNRHALALSALFMAVTTPQAGPIFLTPPEQNGAAPPSSILGTPDYMGPSPHLNFQFATDPQKHQLELLGRINVRQSRHTFGIFKTADGNIAAIDCPSLSKFLTYTILSQLKAEKTHDEDSKTKLGTLYKDIQHGINMLECPVLKA